MNGIIERFKDRLNQEGRGYKWFLRNYLPEIKYHTFVSQISHFNPLSEEVKEAMRKYLAE